MDIHALHFCDVTLSSKKPLSGAYPKTLKTLGDHLRKRRLDLKLFQKDVAKLLSVGEATIYSWERGRTKPQIRYMPKIIQFLGYKSSELKLSDLGDQIKAYRISLFPTWEVQKQLNRDREKGTSRLKVAESCIGSKE